MLINDRVCLILLVACATAEIEVNPLTAERDDKGHLALNRRQRSPYKIGLFMINKFLQTATKFSTSEFQWTYRKIGNYRSALKDFESLNPTGVRDVRLANGMIAKEGTINGNTKLYLFKPTKYDRTTLDIIQTGEEKAPMLTIKYRF